MRSFTLLSFAVLLGSTAAHAQQKRVSYEISFPNLAQHEAHVIATFSGIKRGNVLRVRMSRSSPGRYAASSFAKNVYDVSATDGRGHAATIKRPDAYGWNIVGQGETLRISYTVWGDRIDGTFLSVDHFHAHLNMPATFVWAEGMENAPVRLSIAVPPGWSVATQLKPTDDSTVFVAPTLQYFMDSPTEVGPVTWRTWTNAYHGRPFTWRIAAHQLGSEAQVDTFAAMARRIVGEEVALWGEPAHYDFGTYTFIADYLPWGTSDGMEHRNSAILTGRRGLDTEATRMAKLESLAHEFFHSWNMERLRSKQIEPFDFNRENMSDGLWFGEGFTNYYGLVLLRRAGFYTDSAFVAQLGAEIAGAINSPARRHGSPVEMSRKAVFFDGGSFVDGTNAPNTFLTYYTYGMVVAAGLDLTLRERFKTSLDEYMRALWRDYGRHQSKLLEPQRPYTVMDLRHELAKLTHDSVFAQQYFDRYVNGREVPDFAKLVAPAGFRFASNGLDHPYLGATLSTDPKGVLVNWSWESSSAYDAGLSSGDVIVSIDDVSVHSAEALAAIIAKHQIGNLLRVEVLQKGTIPFVAAIRLKGAPTFTLDTFESLGLALTDSTMAFRANWLGSKVARSDTSAFKTLLRPSRRIGG